MYCDGELVVNNMVAKEASSLALLSSKRAPWSTQTIEVALK
jgi:hypothetical protein